MTSQVAVPSKETKKAISPNHPRKRVGKTAKDRANKALNTAIENRQARADWQNNGGAFPYAHCNGKRNKTVYTGKGNRQVVLTVKSEAKTKRR